MKKIISMATSFGMGFLFFLAGGAIATEITPEPIAQEVVAEEPVAEPEVVVEDVAVEEQEQRPFFDEDLLTNPVFCWNIGESNELGGNCFCVEGSVTDMAEVDCLIASGIVGEDTRYSYMVLLGIIEPGDPMP